MAIQTFTAGQVLTAAQMNSLQANDYNQTVSTKTANYVLVAADKGTRIEMNKSGAGTVTVNTGLFSAGDTLIISNISADAVTVTAGTATVVGQNLVIPQYGQGTLFFSSASASIFFLAGSGPALPIIADYLVIAGGAGGAPGTTGVAFGGGGGGGGFRSSVSATGGGGALETGFTITSGVTYTITVGGGGASDTNGVDSSIAGTGITTITSTGGGKGGKSIVLLPATGGSGGGGASGAVNAGAAGTANQGFAGGSGRGSPNNAGGGGGAGAVGLDAILNGDGGVGTATLISGSSVTRAAGGGGAPVGVGGTGGGGNGNTGGAGTAGTANTGGGGGGGNATGSAAGGAGGSGLIIIRTLDSVADASTLTVGTQTTSGGYKIYTFNASGTIAWASL
jgi:hypothetical protein